ncbi:hypothetical protein JCM8097_005688 [Rhodosporidiobolus ruineniae]
MARTKPSKSSTPVLGLNWQDYYATESARLRNEHPKMKHKQIVKRASQNYRKLKQKLAEEKGLLGSGDENE